MILPLLLLGGFGILLTSIIDGFEEEECYDQEDEADVLQSVDEVRDEAPPVSLLIGNQPAGSIDLPSIEPDTELETVVLHESTSEASYQMDISDETAGPELPIYNLNVLTLDITSANEMDSTDPLVDFNSNPNTIILDINEIDHINIDIDPEEGHVEVLRADYYERLGNDDEENSGTLHTGVNFYFVPHNETYPEEYVWSDNSANLYNEETYVNDSSDFGGIRLILRVDTGVLYNSNSYESEMNFSNRMFDELQEMIIHN